MPAAWHTITLTADQPTGGMNGKQVLLPQEASDAGKPRLLATGNNHTKILTAGTHVDEHTAAVLLPALIKLLGEHNPPTLRYGAATLMDRGRYDRSFQITVAIALVALLAAAGTFILAIVKGLGDTSAPVWLVITVAALVFLGALGKAVKDIYDASSS